MPTEVIQSYRIDPAELPNEAVIFGSTAVMREVHGQIGRILHSDLPVLIRGESGTGKEVVAKFLHLRSNRCEGPFVKVNCSAVPEGLAETELFGCGLGQTGSAIRRGLVDLAAGGTLFLDEIGDLGWTLQSKLLHLLQDGQYALSEGRQGHPVRVRVICATNSDLEKAVEKRAFRQDLFYRIDVINLRLAPLRDRKEDIPQLCEHFMHKLSRKFDKVVPPLTPAALHLLRQWNWPGNMRELENWIAKVIILGDDRAIGMELPRQMARSANAQPRNGHLKEAARQASATAARATILKVLRANHWNRRKAAEELNLSYRSLLYKLRDAGVPLRRKSHKRRRPKS
jgi:two-component system, NtrC family, response regulator AtoC